MFPLPVQVVETFGSALAETGQAEEAIQVIYICVINLERLALWKLYVLAMVIQSSHCVECPGRFYSKLYSCLQVLDSKSKSATSLRWPDWSDCVLI